MMPVPTKKSFGGFMHGRRLWGRVPRELRLLVRPQSGRPPQQIAGVGRVMVAAGGVVVTPEPALATGCRKPAVGPKCDRALVSWHWEEVALGQHQDQDRQPEVLSDGQHHHDATLTQGWVEQKINHGKSPLG